VIFVLSYSDRFYYWNTKTEQVSWLSPLHPKAVITISAEKVNGKDTGFYNIVVTVC